MREARELLRRAMGMFVSGELVAQPSLVVNRGGDLCLRMRWMLERKPVQLTVLLTEEAWARSLDDLFDEFRARALDSHVPIDATLEMGGLDEVTELDLQALTRYRQVRAHLTTRGYEIAQSG